MKTRILSILTIFTICVGMNAQNVNIPDVNFKTYLVGNTAINTNNDTEIQVSEASAFTGSIDCSNKSISDLTGIEEFPNIVELICDRNNLTSINISNNTALTLLNVDRNSLTNLDASANAALYHLYAQRNQLTTISTNSALAGGLYLAYNNFTTLDVSNNTALTELACQNNALTTLDVTANSSLFGLYCQDNALTSLNVANGSNIGMGFNATNNPNLTCIEVDDVAWSTANWTNIDATASYSTNCPPPTCTVNIPDANFKAYLVGNTSINTNNDSEIQCSEATAFTGTINCEWLSISDLTGLEAFTNITELNIEGNSLINLDLSANTALTTLNANINNLTSLNVSAITTLIELNCIDNNLTSLDVSSNTNLDILKVYNNELTSLNVSANTALTDLECNGNYITSLDVSNNLNLIWLITGNNNITSLDLSANTSLIYLECQVNELTSLNIANGNNTNLVTADFDATSNPNLTCIQVDDVAYSTTNWTNIDAVASFRTNCSTCIVNIPDANFKAYLVGNTSINTNNDAEIQCSEATAFTGLINCASLSISDLTGIEAFINITDLLCNNNNLTSIDISAIPNLGGLDCSDNQLTSLNTSLNTSLYNLRCANNALTSIDLSSHTYINTLYCNGNNITTLNLSNLTTLYDLNCSNNQITSIDASNIPLQYFECQNNALTSLNVANGNNYNIVDFDATSNSSLTCITVDDVAYSNTNWSSYKDAGASFSANCAAQQYTLTINATNGTVTTNPNPTSGTYADGTVVALTAVPASGYQFTGWSGAASGTTNPVNVTMDADKTVTANFSLITVVQRTLTINATNGSVTTNPNPTSGTYANGTVVTLIATPNPGYAFVGWSGAATGTTNPLNITMDANKTITAVFTSTAIQRTLTINATNGAVTTNPNPTSGTYNNGTVVTLTATPNAGYAFTGWSGAASGSTNSVNVTMNANKTVTATFSLTTTTTWIGNTTLWSTPSNWDNGIPTALSDAIIPSGLSIYPTASTAVTFNSLTIESGGSFIAQSTVTGNVTYNRTVTSDWHLLAAPVVGQDIAAIKNDVAVNGVKYAVAPYDNTQSSPLLRYNYFTTASGTNNINTAGDFEAAKGYSVKKATAGDISFTGTLNTADVPMAITDNVTTGGNNWNLVGNPFTASLNGNNNANTTNNFLTVNANQLDPARVAVYLWDAATSSYNIMNQTTTATKYIAPGQGFFVASKNAGGTLQFTEAMQTHQTGNIFSRTSNNTVPSIELFVSNGSSQKTTSVKYYDTATIGLDVGYDAGIFSGEKQEFNVYTQLLSNDTTIGFGIQSLPTNNYDAMVIPLGLDAIANSTLSFTIDAQNLPAGIKVHLEDRLENTFTELNTTQENYMVTISNALNGSGRFYIYTTSSILSVDNDIAALNSIRIYKSSKKTLTITGLENQERNNVKVYNTIGKQVFNGAVKAQQKVIIPLPISLSTGMYVVKLQTANGSINKKVFID